ncbi:hypothetical protein Tco_1201718 [Tanacetum coccineum]
MASRFKGSSPNSAFAHRRYDNGGSRFLRYIDTRPNGDALRKCILTESDYLLLTGIGDEIYSTIDCFVRQLNEMWEAIERFYTSYKEKRLPQPYTLHLSKLLKKDSVILNKLKKDQRICRKEFGSHCNSPSRKKTLLNLTNNNSDFPNTRNKNRILIRRHRDDNQNGQLGIKRSVYVVGARENVGGQ